MRRSTTPLITLVAALALAGCATRAKTQPAPGTLGDAARAPFEDVGLVRPEAPRLLSGIKDPYDLEGLGQRCDEIAKQIAALNGLLGAEDYSQNSNKGGTMRSTVSGAAFSAAEDAATGFIPFRSWVRRVSGASKAEREVAHAIEMGRARRAFLRGYGVASRCPDVLPRPPAPTATAP